MTTKVMFYDKDEVADYLQARAIKSGRSLSQIAEKMDCTRSYVWQLLNQTGSDHSIDQYILLAEVMGLELQVTTSYEFQLIGETDDKSRKQST
jgi:transcriptional regulator with XRE-family HTH domain